MGAVHRLSRAFLDAPVADWTAVVFPDKKTEFNQRVLNNLRSLKHPPSKIIRIPQAGIFPEKAAWEWALPQVATEFVAHVDSDMLLDPMSTDRMLRSFQPQIGAVAAWLRDPVSGKEGHFKMWRVDDMRAVIEKVNVLPNLPDTSVQNGLSLIGKYMCFIRNVVGTHAIDLEPFNIFQMYLRRGHKHLARGWVGTQTSTDDIARVVNQKDNGWSQIAMVGFHAGIQLEHNTDVHDSKWYSLARTHYEKVKTYCESIAAKEREKPKKSGKINVLFACPSFGLGGIENVITNIAVGLDPAKFEVTLALEFGKEQFRCATLEKNGIRVTELLENKPYEDEEKEEIWAKYLDNNKVDIVITSSFIPCQIYIPAIERGLPMVDLRNCLSGVNREPTGHNIPMTFFDELLYEYNQHHASSRGKVVYNGVDLSRFTPRTPEESLAAREKLGMRPDAFIFGTVARIDHHKNISMHIKALLNLIGSGEDAEFHIVGAVSDELELEKLQTLIAENGLHTRVVFHPPTNDVTNFLAAIDVFAIASDCEGVPNALLEAMAMKKPVVATAVGGVREVAEGLAYITDSTTDVDKFVAGIRQFRNTREVNYPTIVRHDMKVFVNSMTKIFEDLYVSFFQALPYPLPINVAFLLGSAKDVEVVKNLTQDLDAGVFVYCVENCPIDQATVRVISGTPNVVRAKTIRWIFDDKINLVVKVNYPIDPFTVVQPCKVTDYIGLDQTAIKKLLNE